MKDYARTGYYGRPVKLIVLENETEGKKKGRNKARKKERKKKRNKETNKQRIKQNEARINLAKN